MENYILGEKYEYFQSLNQGGGLCIASLFFMAMSCDLPGPVDDKTKPPTSGVTTPAGGSRGFANAIGRDAKFDSPAGLALSEDEQTLYIADRGNNCIRKFDIASRNVSTLNPYKKLQGRISISFNDIQCLILYDSLLFRPELAENSSQRRRNTCFEPVRMIIRTVLSRRFVYADTANLRDNPLHSGRSFSRY